MRNIIITLSLDATFRKEGKLTQQVLLRKRPDHLRLVWFSCDRSRRARASREAAAAGPPWGPRRARAASRHMPGGRGAPPACTSRERARDYRQLWATSLRRPSQPVLLELRSARNWRAVRAGRHCRAPTNTSRSPRLASPVPLIPRPLAWTDWLWTDVLLIQIPYFNKTQYCTLLFSYMYSLSKYG